MPMMTERAVRGQTIVTETGADRSSPLSKIDTKEAIMGKPMGGGVRDLSHSIPGASTTDYNNKRPRRRSSGDE